jgi:CRISPR-associated protein Csm4
MGMKLIRFRLRPKTAWMTLWQADTIGGLLAALYAREAPEEAEKRLIEPWRRGRPSLVVSDAFPGDLLPAPANLGLFPGIREEDRKKVRRAAWLTPEEFRAVQRGDLPPGLFEADRKDPYRETVRLRNSIDRAVNSTGQSGELYEAAGQSLRQGGFLSVYAWVVEDSVAWATKLFGLLAETGFGADAGVGAGEVEVEGPATAGIDAYHFRERDGDVVEVGPADTADDVEPADVGGGWVSLSTFQPAASDPTEGYWRSFIKYGKLGPDFAVESVFKRPQWMLRAGACFRDAGPRRPWYGGWIGTEQLLPEKLREKLEGQGVRPGQPAFALALPLRWREAG